jgi:hypothetical protein
VPVTAILVSDVLIRSLDLILQAMQQPRCVCGWEVVSKHCSVQMACMRVTIGLVGCALNGAHAVCLQEMTFGQAAHVFVSSHVDAVHSVSWESDFLWHVENMAVQGTNCKYHGQTHRWCWGEECNASCL